MDLTSVDYNWVVCLDTLLAQKSMASHRGALLPLRKHAPIKGLRAESLRGPKSNDRPVTNT